MNNFGVVIPAYNEANNLSRVLEVIGTIDWLVQIVVVDDGSHDGTWAVAQRFALHFEQISVVRLSQNRGKGAAMLAGVHALHTDFVIFLDADLIGLQRQHLEQLRQPLLHNNSEMSVAVFRDGGVLTNASHWLTPSLSGQRCLPHRAAVKALTLLSDSRYGVETGLTCYAKKNRWRCRYVPWQGVTHVMKETKLGFFNGLRSRWQMYGQILLTILLIMAPAWYFGVLRSKNRRRFIWRIPLVFGLTIAVFGFAGYQKLQAHTGLRLHDLAALQPQSYRRILVFAPHPDDEVLAAGGVISAALAANPPATVRVVIVTNGDASFSAALLNGYNPVAQNGYQKLARVRQQESLQALTSLGLSEDQIQFWDFPDRGLEEIWRHHWTDSQPYRSNYTGLTATAGTLHSPDNIPYTGAALLKQIRSILANFQPDVVIMPHPSDAHPDHRALAYLINLAIALNKANRQSPPPQMFAYVMWLSSRPRPVSIRLDREWQKLPGRFPANANQWGRVSLTSTVQQRKIVALKAYHSQMRSLRTLMRSAGSDTELFNQLVLHPIPYLPTPVALPPDEQWWSTRYQNEWAVPGAGLVGLRPQTVWAVADPGQLWLAARLPGPSRPGIQYTFVLRTVHQHQPVEIQLTANPVINTPDNRVYVVAQLPLERIESVLATPVFMMSLQTQMAGHTPLMRSEWYSLSLLKNVGRGGAESRE